MSFPNFVERSTLKLPLSELCAAPFVLQKRGGEKGEGAEKGEKEGRPAKGAIKKKRTRENRSENLELILMHI